MRTRTRGRLGAGGGGVRVDPVARKVMTGGPHRSATAGVAQAKRWDGVGGLLGQLGCTATGRAGLAGAARTSWRAARCWAAARGGWARKGRRAESEGGTG
jgi:hypothetical protein